MKPECVICGDEYEEERARLGYDTCLTDGQKEAELEMEEKFQRTAPAFNKGGYQYITDDSDLSSLGRKK